MRSGILLIDKPEGPSSARVVEKVKALLGARKAGHLGTLDPFASGLLPLGINEGTKIAEIFLNAVKSYSGIAQLGVETDTQDSTGKILEVRETRPLGQKDIDDLREAFMGRIKQVPPMFSALKRQGVRLYRLARQGKSVPRAPREIKIERLKLWPLSPTELGFEVTCSKGTYIRTLAADMGSFLGCGAHLKSLRRLSCAHLTIEDAITLGELEALKRERKEIPLISLSQALRHLREFRLEDSLYSRLRMGQQEALSVLGTPREDEKILRLVNNRGDLVALARWGLGGEGAKWRLLRIFS
ncbi:MAG: tRNA pseudouridine(55) synthase TruB [Deltaproteobacteria bacterium]|nr:tRNA pseudouridine(55) synthase TruB [Deltaproteobacteria bacterium]